MKRMLRWRIRRCIASLLVMAMTCPLGYTPVARALAPSAEAAPARQQSVVVFELQNKSKEGAEGLARAITRQIRLVMDQSPAFDLVTYTTAPPHSPSIERALKEGQLTEQELSGVPEPATAVKIAQILGAECALLGEIDEDGYEYNAEQKRVTIKLIAYLYSTATGQPVNSVTVQGEGTGEGMKGALEERARLDAAQRLERKLSGRAEPTDSGNRRPTMRKWLPWVLGGLAVGVLVVALAGKKSKKGPAAPGAVTVTGTSTGVRLSWAPSPGAETYRIYRATTSGTTNVGGLSYQMINEVPASVVQYDDNPNALPANASYAYQVASVAGGQEGSRMSGDRQVGPGEPSPVMDVQAAVNNRTILVSWAASSEDFVKSYRVYRSTQLSEWDSSDYRVVQAPTHSYTDSGLAGGQTYFYKVSAVGTTGRESAWRQQAAVARPTGTQPTAPTSVDAQPVDASRPTVKITWRATGEPDVTSYEVMRGMSRVRGMAPPGYGILWNKSGKGAASRGGPFQQIGTVTAGGTMEWVDADGLQYDTTYYYTVRALTNQGPSANSEVVSATPNSQPHIVQNVTATAGDHKVTVRWSSLAEPDLAGYNVYRQTADQPTTRTKLTDQPVTVLQYIDTTPVNDTRYQYFVRAVDLSDWEGPLSLPAEATPTAPPEAPSNVRASAGDNRISILWDKSSESNISRYNVYRSDSPTMTPVFLDDVSATSADPATIMYVDAAPQSSSPPQNRVTYYYQVTAVNTSGVESERSPSGTPVSATPSVPPAAPLNVQASGGASSVTITWNPVTRLADPDGRLLSDVGRTLRGYRIYRAVASSSTVSDDVRTLVEDLPLASLAGQPKYEDKKAPAGIGLRYAVTATMLDSNGGIVESEFGLPDSTAPVIVVRRLAAPQNFAGAPDDSAVRFTWTGSTDPSALGYVIYGSQSQTGPYVALFPAVSTGGTPTVPAASTSYNLVASAGLPIPLANDVRFWFKMAAVDKLGVEGIASTEIPVIPNPKPAAPVEAAAYNTYTSSSSDLPDVLDMALRVNWKVPAASGLNIYGYRVYRATSASGPFERVTADDAEERGLLATRSFIDRFRTGSVSLPEANGQDFYYQVRTLVEYTTAGVVESDPSNTAGPTRVINIPPSKVQNLRVTEANGIVTLRWDQLLDPVTMQGVSDLSRYTIGRRIKGDTTGAEVLFPVGGDVLLYYDTDVVRGQTYVYRVQGVDFINPGPWSDEVEVTVSP